MPGRIPLVDYLALEPEPHLVAQVCTSCGAPYFDHRVACANCFGQDFRAEPVATEGEVISFTIVAFGAPGVKVPFVAALIECGGVRVAGNIVDTPPDPEHVKLGMKVRLTTFSLGVDGEGTEAIGFGFAPIEQTGVSGG
ncbi:MAG: putative nucleic-acid-binding protein containing a Zn-ribbon [Frankiales bacterium]|nr:putative nucleic-acid-binding protein containing a Zn-ribbon [Frankiales bacterium]